MKLLLESPLEPAEMLRKLTEFIDFMIKQRAMAMKNGEIEPPFCLWGDLVTTLCNEGGLRKGIASRLDHRGATKAADLLVQVLGLLVARGLSGPSAGLDILLEFMPECADESVLHATKVSGLVCEACGGSRGVHHEKACDLFRRTVDRLGKFYPKDDIAWQKSVEGLVVQRMSSLCVDGKSLKDLLIVVWKVFINERSFHDAAVYIRDALIHSGAYKALCGLEDDERKAIVEMVQKQILLLDNMLETILETAPNEEKRKLGRAITEYRNLKRTIENPVQSL